MRDTMRGGFIVMLIVVILFGGGYFYYIAQAVCPAPLKYSLGQVDERFGLSYDEAKLAISEAAELWEEVTGRNLFSYDNSSMFLINFIFDERQAFSNAENRFKEKLDAAENINDAIESTYTSLVEQYDKVRLAYLTKVEEYETRLNLYNQKVSRYNEEGGAPPEMFDELEREKKELDRQQHSLNILAGQLNEMVTEINRLGEKGNSLVETYNEGVGAYNEAFGELREFTQGDYQGDQINIYAYEDKDELKLVLAHELGHALSLDHVSGPESIMFHLIGEQPIDIRLSKYDTAEFDRVCGERSFWDKMNTGIQVLFKI